MVQFKIMHKIKGRHIQIVCYLLEQRYPVPASEILKELDINANTFRKDIPQINGLLEESGLSLVSKGKEGLGLVGSAENVENLRKRLDSLGEKALPRKKKIWYIAGVCLSSERIPTVEDLCEILDVSRPTVIEYIKEVNGWLFDKGIALLSRAGFGYFIEGKEEDVRDAFVKAFENYSGAEFQKMAKAFAEGNFDGKISALEGTNWGSIKRLIENAETGIGKTFTEESTLELAITVAVSVRRIREGRAVTFEPKEVRAVLANPISTAVKNSISAMKSQFQVEFADSEIVNFALKFVSAKIGKIEGAGKFMVTSRFQRTAEEIVQLANELLGSTISKDDGLVSMLAYHLESAISKVNMGAKVEEPVLGGIEKEYPVAYAIGERACKLIEDSRHLKIPDEEKGAIAMYVAALLEKARQPCKKKVAVICSMGIVSSKLLYYELTNEIPEVELVQVGSIRELEEGKIQGTVDLIISTVPVYNVNVPHIIVPPILGLKDKRSIRAMLKTGKGDWTGDTAARSIFDRGLICPQVNAGSWREVIKLLGNRLVKNGFARDGLVVNVLSREKKFPTGINTDIAIAIPHGSSEFTLRKGFAIATLRNPAKFGEMSNPDKTVDVRIVIMPTLTGKEEDAKEFYEIIRKLGDHKVASEVLQCHSSQTIERVLTKS